MAIFDDPKKQLDWMARELLAQEQEEVLPEEPEGNRISQAEEEDDLMQRIDALIGDDSAVPKANPAVDLPRMVCVEEPVKKGKKTRAAKAVQAQIQTQPEGKEKGIKGLVFLAILETLGILAIIGWWLRWLL